MSSGVSLKVKLLITSVNEVSSATDKVFCPVTMTAGGAVIFDENTPSEGL